MELATFQFKRDSGWTIKEFPFLDSKNTLILMFAAPEFIHHLEPFRQLKAFYSQSKIIGCSCKGEMIGSYMNETVPVVDVVDHAISVAVIRFESTKIDYGFIEGNQIQNPHESAKIIYDKLYNKNLKGLLVFSSGILNCFEMIDKLNAAKRDAVITGCVMNGDASWINVNGDIHNNGMVAIGLYGEYINIDRINNANLTTYPSNIPMLAMAMAKMKNLNDDSSEELIEKALTYLPSQTQLIGLYPDAFIQEDAIKNSDEDNQLMLTIINEPNQVLDFAKIIRGEILAKKIRLDIANEIRNYKKYYKKPIQLRSISVGDNPVSKIFMSSIHHACNEVGIYFSEQCLDKSIHEEVLINCIRDCNINPEINGIVIQLPLPEHINPNTIFQSINPDKDVDCVHPHNLGKLLQRTPRFYPCTAYGVIQLLQSIHQEIKGKHVVVVGSSNVGKTMVIELLLVNCTVTVCNFFTNDLSSHVNQADILISEVGLNTAQLLLILVLRVCLTAKL